MQYIHLGKNDIVLVSSPFLDLKKQVKLLYYHVEQQVE